MPHPDPDLSPPDRRTWRGEVNLIAGVGLATAAVLVAGLHLVAVTTAGESPGPGMAVAADLPLRLRVDVADLRVPFRYDEDALLILPLVKSAVERGSHWRTDRLGAPGVQELHDFPVVDHLHFAALWLVHRVVRQPVVAFNLYFLLGYPLAAMTAAFALRRVGLSAAAAAAGGLLYAFLPYHQDRGQVHYFLSAYWVVPLTTLVALAACRGAVPFVRRRPGGGYRFAPWTAGTGWAVAVLLLTSAGGAYYAFFGCALLCCAAAYGGLAEGSWQVAAGGGLAVAVVAAGGLAQHAPTAAYQAAYGRHDGPTRRQAEEAEMYGLKLTQVLLPIADHNVVRVGRRVVADPAAARVRYANPTRPLNGFPETHWTAVGAVAGAGLVGLLAALVLPVRADAVTGPAAALAGFGVLLATVGGFGDLFNFYVSAQVRAYNRIVVYLAFLGLLAALRWADRRLPADPPGVRWAGFAAVAAFGVWDQTDTTWFPQVRPPAYRARAGVDAARGRVADRWEADRRFYAKVDAVAGRRPVFYLPVVPYPEHPPYSEPGAPGAIGRYEPVRGYLHTSWLRLSYGAMAGREADRWQRQVARDAPARLAERLVLRGFEGVLVDARGLAPDRRAGVEAALADAPVRLRHDDEPLTYYSLAAVRRRLERELGPAGLAEAAAAEAGALTWLWLAGWESYQPVGLEDRQHYGRASALCVLVNPTARPRPARLAVTLHGWADGPVAVAIDGGPVWTAAASADAAGHHLSAELTVPPGRHRIRFRATPPVGYVFPDSRDLVFGARDFRLTEPPAGE